MEVSRTIRAKKIKTERIKNKLPVYNAGLGENPCPVPPSIVEALKEHVGKKSYSSAEGIPELQKHFPSQTLIVGNGLKPLLMIVQLAFGRLYTDGIIVHIIPSWVSYMEQTSLLQLNTVQVETKASKLWRLEPNNLRETFEKNNLKTKPHMILLNSPNNPTGHVYTDMEMRAFGEVFNEYGTIVLYDNIYEHLVFPSFKNAGDIRDYVSNVITASSLSKNFAAGGFRLGWLAFPKAIHAMRNLWNVCLCLSSYIYTCPTTPIQYAGAHALSLSGDIPAYLTFQKNMFDGISKIVVHKLRAMGLRCTTTEGAYYTLVDFEKYTEKFQEHQIFTSDDLCFHLAETMGLITVSGDAFGIKNPYVLRYSIVDIKNIDVQQNSYNFLAIGNFMHKLETWLQQL